MTFLTTAAFASDIVFENGSDRLDGILLVSFPYQGSGYSGVGMLDADQDGDLDLYFGNGPTQENALLINDGTAWFTDVAADVGAAVLTGSSGVLAADLDNDSFPELVLAGDRAPLRVLGNLGDGTFLDVTLPSGLEGARRNTSPHAGDIDNDGDLDVYVTGGIVPEDNYENTLWRNDGGRSFVEIGAAAGVGTALGGCAAIFTHLDDDVAIDLLVANCNDLEGTEQPFEVYHNNGDGTFTNVMTQSGIWERGFFMASVIFDFDGDLRLDFFSTNVGTVGEFRDGPHVLYRANGDGTFTDVAAQAGVAEREFGWGAVAADFDNDGWEELYYVGKAHAPDGVESPGLLFENQADGTFAEPEIPYDLRGLYTTGLATGDVDGDGGMDLAIVVTQSPDGTVPGAPILLLNRTANGNHWIDVRLQGTWDNRPAIGSVVYATADGRPQIREVHAGSGYMSTSSAWPHFGLGSATEAELCVRWPDGSEEGFGTHAADQWVDIVQGQGTAASCPRPDDLDVPPQPPPEDHRTCGCAGGPTGAPAFWAALVATALALRSTWRGTRGPLRRPARPRPA